MRILIVEDDPDLSRQLGDALKDQGYAVDVAGDGEEGHFLGDTEPYDAVILDLGLPLIDGVSVLQKWRSDGKTFPVIILRLGICSLITARPALLWTAARLSSPPMNFA